MTTYKVDEEKTKDLLSSRYQVALSKLHTLYDNEDNYRGLLSRLVRMMFKDIRSFFY